MSWRSFWILAFFGALGIASASAEPYWVAWEGDDLPEDAGWSRNWGNWDGQYEGDGAVRSLQDGALTYDSLSDPGIFDYNLMYRPGNLDPDPGEWFVLEWGLQVNQIVGDFDPDVEVRSDDGWGVGLLYAHDHVWSLFEDETIPIVPGVFHDYRLVSADMRDYELYIDGVSVWHGAFVDLVVQSYVAWGDGVQGRTSVVSHIYTDV